MFLFIRLKTLRIALNCHLIEDKYLNLIRLYIETDKRKNTRNEIENEKGNVTRRQQPDQDNQASAGAKKIYRFSEKYYTLQNIQISHNLNI